MDVVARAAHRGPGLALQERRLHDIIAGVGVGGGGYRKVTAFCE